MIEREKKKVPCWKWLSKNERIPNVRHAEKNQQMLNMKPPVFGGVTHNEESMTTKLVTEIGNFTWKHDETTATTKKDIAQRKRERERESTKIYIIEK